MGTMGDNSRSKPNVRRVALGLIGLVVGLVIIVVGINALSTSDTPPPETPRVQTGSLPIGTARTTAVSDPSTGSTSTSSSRSDGTAPPS
jgi:hypothetical protein